MNEVVDIELSAKIAEKLANGEEPEQIASDLSCDLSCVLAVSRGSQFVSINAEILEEKVKSSSLVAINSIAKLIKSRKTSDSVRLKAACYIVDKALEYNLAQGDDTSPSNMTQAKLVARLNDLQKEAIKRAKPIDTGVTDMDDLMS